MQSVLITTNVESHSGEVYSMQDYIWDPYNTGQINQLDKAQRRAARFTTKNYTDRQPGSVTQMVTQHGWEPLQGRRVNDPPPFAI